jgi:flagella basal body P-ring formation protein FlgA
MRTFDSIRIRRIALQAILPLLTLTLLPPLFAEVPAQVALAAPAPTVADGNINALLEREAAGHGWRLEINVGQLDSRMTLAPCANIEPFLPAGTRPWGRIQVGMRCKEGAAWTVYLPVNVKVFGQALSAKKSLMSGSHPADSDVELIDTELSRETGTPVTELKQLAGRILTRALFPGQVLRLEQFRAAPVIGQGDQVKLVANGPGFSVSAEGEALAHAAEGQVVRVKTDTGRIVSGTAHQGGIVELRF